jgi:hypothetical protein
VHWLGEYARITAAIVAAVNGEGTRLVGIAEAGVSDRGGHEMVVDLEDHGHPLIDALSAKPAASFVSSITVVSTLGRGSTFTVFLPAWKDREAAVRPSAGGGTLAAPAG